MTEQSAMLLSRLGTNLLPKLFGSLLMGNEKDKAADLSDEDSDDDDIVSDSGSFFQDSS